MEKPIGGNRISDRPGKPLGGLLIRRTEKHMHWSAKHFLRDFVLLAFALLIFGPLKAQPGVDDYAYRRCIVYHADQTHCQHLPPDVSFIVMLNHSDSLILTDQCPRWTEGEPNINGDGMMGVELGNFTNPSVAVNDSFTIIFSCNVTGEQGTDEGEVSSLPYSALNVHLQLLPQNYLPPVKKVTAKLKDESVQISWQKTQAASYLIYRRDLADVLSDGRARFQYRKIAQVSGDDSTYSDETIVSGHTYGYLLLAKDAQGRLSARSQEAIAVSPIAITAVIPRNTSVEIHFKSGVGNGNLSIAGFNVYRRTANASYNNTPVIFLGPADTCMTDTRLQPGTVYYYTIRSRDAQGNELSASDEIKAVTDNQPQKYFKFATLDVLVVLYTHTSGGDIAPEDIPKIKKMIELARLFYWRNSGLKMNLNISYLIIDDYLDSNPNDYSLTRLQNDLHARGVKDLQYDAIFRISSGTSGFWSYGTPSWSFMGPPNSTGFSHVCWAAAKNTRTVPYPTSDTNINCSLTWLFIHEFQHAMDDIYNDNGNPEMYHGDFPWKFPVACGEEYDFQAKIFRAFRNWLALKGYRGQIYETNDADKDGIPDCDARVALDEVRFHSDSLRPDTDGDGLSDYGEMIAGIYEGTNPNKSDTDGDSIPDNRDPFPLYSVHQNIPYFSPVLNGTIESGWHLLVDRMNFSTRTFTCKIYLNWDTDNLYIAFFMKEYAIPTVFLDGQANGWWYGRDNYRISFNPTNGAIREARVLDCTPEAIQYHESLEGGGPMWDNDPQYYKHFGRIIQNSDFQIFCRTSTKGYFAEMVIPRNDRSGLTFAQGDSIGLRFLFEDIESSWDHWATAFENYSFVNVKLASATSVRHDSPFPSVPSRFVLEQNYPNPFNPSTTIRYALPAISPVDISIFNELGQKVKTLIHVANQPPGFYRIQWDGNDDNGKRAPNGVYFYRMQARGVSLTRKMLLLN